jgi:tetratricopeptide (TPR) repeat protein
VKLGEALAKQGNLDAAIAHYSEALRLQPDYAQAHSSLADALALRGEIDEAIREYQAALAIDPQFEAARRAVDDLARRKRARSRSGA